MQTDISVTLDLAEVEATANIFLIAYRALPQEARQIISNQIRMGEFWEDKHVSELARLQGVTTVENIDNLRTDFWPTDDSIDEMLEAVRSWRDASLTSKSSLEQS